MTETINGYPIIKETATPAAPMTRAGRVILVDRGEDTFQRWVTAWVGNGDTSWCHGHYIDSRAEAEADYMMRCGRSY